MQPKPGLALLPEPIALALDHEGVAVMQESIEDGAGVDAGPAAVRGPAWVRGRLRG